MVHRRNDDIEELPQIFFTRNESDDRFFFRLPNDFRIEWVLRDHRVGHREVKQRTCEGAELVAGGGSLALADEADLGGDVGVVNTGRESFHRAGKRCAEFRAPVPLPDPR